MAHLRCDLSDAPAAGPSLVVRSERTRARGGPSPLPQQGCRDRQEAAA